MLSIQAAIIDFQQLEHIDVFTIDHDFQYIEDGFQIDDLTQVHGLNTFGTLASGYTGSTAMFNDTINGVTQLRKVGGGTFDLFSIDIAELNDPSVASITFTRDGGHSQVFTLDGVAFGAETFLFDSGFLGTTSVTWTQARPFHQFDNIQIDVAPVPVPAAVWLFGTGLIGLMDMRKKIASRPI